MSTFRLEVVTPERQVLVTEVESVLLSTQAGQLGIWANHAPLIAGLEIGILEYGSKHAGKKKVAIGGGFLEVANNKATILANTAELAEEIDVIRARESRRRAQQRLDDKEEEWKFTRAQLALQKALARLKAADASE